MWDIRYDIAININIGVHLFILIQFFIYFFFISATGELKMMNTLKQAMGTQGHWKAMVRRNFNNELLEYVNSKKTMHW